MHPDDSRPRVSGDGRQPLRSTTSTVGRGRLTAEMIIASLGRPGSEMVRRRSPNCREWGRFDDASASPQDARRRIPRNAGSRLPDGPIEAHRAGGPIDQGGRYLSSCGWRGTGCPTLCGWRAARDLTQAADRHPIGQKVACECRSRRGRWRRGVARSLRCDTPGSGTLCSRRGNCPQWIVSSRATTTRRPSPGEIQWGQTNSAGTSSGNSPESKPEMSLAAPPLPVTKIPRSHRCRARLTPA